MVRKKKMVSITNMVICPVIWEGLDTAEGCVELEVTVEIKLNFRHAAAEVAYERDTDSVAEMVVDALEDGIPSDWGMTNIKVLRFHNNS